MDIFGDTDPRMMPSHLFGDPKHLAYASAVRGNPKKQNCSICPRHWYIDADYDCKSCGREFTWTAREQKAWFEDYFFWIDCYPRSCKNCRAKTRQLEALRKEYDSTVAAARDHGTDYQKARIIEIVSTLEKAFGRLPEKMIETGRIFTLQQNKKQNKAEMATPRNPSDHFGS